MYPATLKIEKLFSVERRCGRTERYTEFGFASGNSRHYSVCVSGWPGIEEGMEITALLQKQGDWSSLLGWINHSSGEVVSPASGTWTFLLVAGFLMMGGVSLGWQAPGPLLLYILFAVPCGIMLRRANRIRNALTVYCRSNEV